MRQVNKKPGKSLGKWNRGLRQLNKMANVQPGTEGQTAPGASTGQNQRPTCSRGAFPPLATRWSRCGTPDLSSQSDSC